MRESGFNMNICAYFAALQQLCCVVHEAVDVLTSAASRQHFCVCACDIHIEDDLTLPGFREKSDGLLIEYVSVDIELE